MMSRKQRFFNSPYSFSERSAVGHTESYMEVASQEDPNFGLQRVEMDMAIQVRGEGEGSDGQRGGDGDEEERGSEGGTGRDEQGRDG